MANYFEENTHTDQSKGKKQTRKLKQRNTHAALAPGGPLRSREQDNRQNAIRRTGRKVQTIRDHHHAASLGILEERGGRKQTKYYQQKENMYVPETKQNQTKKHSSRNSTGPLSAGSGQLRPQAAVTMGPVQHHISVTRTVENRILLRLRVV